MKQIVFMIVAILVAGCANQTVSNSAPGRVPYLKSQLSVAQADNALRKGMSRADVGDLIGSVPGGSLRSTMFSLQDGSLSCQWDSGTLASWSTTKDEEPTEQDE